MPRIVHSIKTELLSKSREAMLSAVGIYNNPNIKFKSETFIVLAIIAWTYLMHAYYKGLGIDYHFYTMHGQRKRYDRTKYGAKKSWELERCLDDARCPVSSETKTNLKFLIGLRHEIEHQMTTKIDDAVSAKFQACCLNYDATIRSLFGDTYNISRDLSVSIQMSAISEPQVEALRDLKDMPKNIASYIDDYDRQIPEEVFNSPQYSYRVLFVPKTANRPGQADKVITFVKADTPEAEGINAQYALIKEREKKKLLPKAIIELLKDKGYHKLNYYHFCQCWKSMNAKKDNTYGALVGGEKWYWYENFIPVVEKYCQDNGL